MVVLLFEGSRPLPTSEEDQETSFPMAKETVAKELGVSWPPLPLDELLPKVDFLSVHCPLTAGTKGLIAERELGLMKSSAIIVNAARGGVVDELGAWALQRGVLVR